VEREAIEREAGGEAHTWIAVRHWEIFRSKRHCAARERFDSSHLRLGHGWPSTVIARIVGLRPMKNRDKL
jgi:hypothetical protein